MREVDRGRIAWRGHKTLVEGAAAWHDHEWWDVVVAATRELFRLGGMLGVWEWKCLEA
jgi:hypothetical protein